MDESLFSDEVAWVTGSTTGIGRATVLGLAARGCNAVVHYNSNESEAQAVAEKIRSMGRRALVVGGDVGNAEDVQRIAREIQDHYGRIDILVNNAGSVVQRATLAEMTEELWDRTINLNLKSVYLCSQAVLPHMKSQGSGRIVNMTSVAARNGGSAGLSAYVAAKGGVGALTRAMAKELVSDGILVNAVAPGVISTPLHDRLSSPEARQKLVSTIPIGREGDPEEVVGTILFLASWHSDYIVGATIDVNGGQSMI